MGYADKYYKMCKIIKHMKEEVRVIRAEYYIIR